MRIFYSGARGDSGPELTTPPKKPNKKFDVMMTWHDFTTADPRRARIRFAAHCKAREGKR